MKDPKEFYPSRIRERNHAFYSDFSPRELRAAARAHNYVMKNLGREDYCVDEEASLECLRQGLIDQLTLMHFEIR